METINLIEITKDGDQWCAIYPMGSDLMTCIAVAFSPVDYHFNDMIGRWRDYGFREVLDKLKRENPNLPTTSFYSDFWD